MNLVDTDGTRVVYRRTLKGQFAVARASNPDDETLDPVQRRLLLMVNGFTSLHDIARVARFQVCAEEAAQALAACGLIEALVQEPPSAAGLRFMKDLPRAGAPAVSSLGDAFTN